jgi:hypothetical protein
MQAQVNRLFTSLWDEREMLKAFLIAAAALITVDAAFWESRYRVEVVQACKNLGRHVTGMDWSSGPLV